jgi:predicted GTPase
MARQAEAAIAEADVLIFVVDVRTGLAPQDKVIAELLRRSGRPVLLAVNKGEGMDRAVVAADFHELGCGDPCVISSAAHGEGVRELVELALARSRTTTRRSLRTAPGSPSSAAPTSARARWSIPCSARSASSPSTCPARRATRSKIPFERGGRATR